MSELIYKDEVFKLVGLCMEVHRELGKGQDEVLYKDALMVELQRAQIPFTRELKYEVAYKGVILPHHYIADFVVWNKIMFEAKAVEQLTERPRKTSVKLSCNFETGIGFAGKLWRRFTRMETRRSQSETETNRTSHKFPSLIIRAN
jgi:GxxExxY protein